MREAETTIKKEQNRSICSASVNLNLSSVLSPPKLFRLWSNRMNRDRCDAIKHIYSPNSHIAHTHTHCTSNRVTFAKRNTIFGNFFVCHFTSHLNRKYVSLVSNNTEFWSIAHEYQIICDLHNFILFCFFASRHLNVCSELRGGHNQCVVSYVRFY